MRSTNTCPKCQGNQIFFTKGKRLDQYGNSLSVSGFKRIPLDHFTCIACGYTEAYVQKVADLDYLRRKFSKQNNRDQNSYTDFV